MSFAACFAFLPLALAVGGGGAAAGRSVVVAGPKEPVRLSGEMSLEVRLENDGQEPFLAFGYLTWGRLGGLVLQIARYPSEEPVEPRFLDDSQIPSAMVNDALAFVRVYPGGFFGRRRADPARLLFDRPGEYLVWVEYRSPVPKRFCPVKGCWSREDGVLVSNRIIVRVLK